MPVDLPSPRHESVAPPKADYPDLFAPIPLYLDDDEKYVNGSVDDWRGKNDPDHRITIQDNLEPLVNASALDPPIFCTNDTPQN